MSDTTITVEPTIIEQPHVREWPAPNLPATISRAPPPDEASHLRMVLGTYLINPEVTTEKVDYILKSIERAEERQREWLFQAAFARAQAKFTRAAKNRKISYPGKDGKPDRNTPYADWHSHWLAAGPHLNAEDLSVWFDIDAAPERPVTVIAKLQGFGITREVKITFHHDPSGQKNPLQAQSSAVMYGRRNTGCAILNLTVEDDELDDDSQAAGGVQKLTEEQAVDILARLETNEIPVNSFCAAMKVANIGDLPADLYEKAISRINVTIANKTKAKAAAEKF